MRAAARAVLALFFATQAAFVQPAPAPQPMAADLREEILPLTVKARDMYGREETRDIALTVFRPPGEGPFPLVVVSHGRATADRRAGQGRQRFEPLARYLVGKGFAVFVPTRIGYGDTYGDFDPESSGNCEALRPTAATQAAADQVLATVALARQLPWVDASRWVAMGQSLGGTATLAVVSRDPPGLVAAVNFAGGMGGNPDTRPANPCSPTVLARLWQDQAAVSRLPMLWIYWLNDRYWGPDWPQRWAKAWTDGGGALSFHQLPAVGSDGHAGLNTDMDHWVPLVEAYLEHAGFGNSGLVRRPPASGHAALEEPPRLLASEGGLALYRRFLAASKPRAFAVGAGGASGFASGDWAMGRALGFCQARRGVPCRLYAVDDDVVWVP